MKGSLIRDPVSAVASEFSSSSFAVTRTRYEPSGIAPVSQA